MKKISIGKFISLVWEYYDEAYHPNSNLLEDLYWWFTSQAATSDFNLDGDENWLTKVRKEDGNLHVTLRTENCLTTWIVNI